MVWYDGGPYEGAPQDEEPRDVYAGGVLVYAIELVGVGAEELVPLPDPDPEPGPEPEPAMLRAAVSGSLRLELPTKAVFG